MKPTRRNRQRDLDKLVQYLREYAQGGALAIPVHRLCLLLGLPYADDTQQSRKNGAGQYFRSLSRDALIAGHPIGYNETGYFYATAADELTFTITRLRATIRTMNRRLRALKATQLRMAA